MLLALLDLVLPRSCAGCRVPGPGLCPGCRTLLAGPSLGQVTPTPCPPGLPPLSAFATYDGPLQRLLLAHKEKGRLQLTAPLGRALASAVLVHGRDPVVLCPVPSSPQAVRTRGHDHAMRLAQAAARELRTQGVDATVGRLLVPARAVADQSGLSTSQRARNLHGALRATGRVGTAVVVVDDVVTTGATLVEAARALRETGHPVRAAAAIATTRRNWMSPSRASPLLPDTEGGYRP